jgi:hypothetical protein
MIALRPNVHETGNQAAALRHSRRDSRRLKNFESAVTDMAQCVPCVKRHGTYNRPHKGIGQRENRVVDGLVWVGPGRRLSAGAVS